MSSKDCHVRDPCIGSQRQKNHWLSFASQPRQMVDLTFLFSETPNLKATWPEEDIQDPTLTSTLNL